MNCAEVDSFYVQHSPLSSPGKHAEAFRMLPDDIEGIIETIQGLLIYDAVAKDFYDCVLSQDRAEDIHLRPVEKILDRVFKLDDRPLTKERLVSNRVAGRCRNYVVMLVGALREKRIPARARCGFCSYLNLDAFEDHWVCEYRDAKSGLWKFADPQLDSVWQRKLQFSHDNCDIPRDEMLVAGDAWKMCRDGHADFSMFGISFERLQGQWMVAGNLVRDIVSLNLKELLPWDVWGGMPVPGESLNDEQLRFFDKIASLSLDPDLYLKEINNICVTDSRLVVSSQVFNALRGRAEHLVV